jgi:hypothetical protein
MSLVVSFPMRYGAQVELGPAVKAGQSASKPSTPVGGARRAPFTDLLQQPLPGDAPSTPDAVLSGKRGVTASNSGLKVTPGSGSRRGQGTPAGIPRRSSLGDVARKP